ncbi:Cro/CI family transcriptional regulator [Salmonella enterica]|nr:hypothetical protein [Salmonella enterica]EMD3058121.1 hypothetical protein [Salmonella enterica]EMD3062718.1 hypothetical protein [Salmonella enterica]EMD3094570.1 hypothetical protein [Salmonella enterica]EMD3454721.1 hypothetical protein [Salmonella enterica]
MLKSEVIAFFGGRGGMGKVAVLLGISYGAVNQWSEIIPKCAALELEKITNGALKCDLSVYKNRPRKNKRSPSTEV